MVINFSQRKVHCHFVFDTRQEETVDISYNTLEYKSIIYYIIAFVVFPRL